MQISEYDIFDNLIAEEHRMIRATCRKFAETEIAPHAHAWEEAEEFPNELFKKAGVAGILGLCFTESVGGACGGTLAQIMGF